MDTKSKISNLTFQIKVEKTISQYWKKIFTTVAVFFVLSMIIIGFIISPPQNFKTGTVFTIQDGESLNKIALLLKEQGFIRSDFLLKVVVTFLFSRPTGVIAGSYVFDRPQSLLSLADKITDDSYHLNPIRITVPEGLNKFEIANLLQTEISGFDSEKFIAIAPEGYLFPDTYFFAPGIGAEKIIEIMKNNFNKQLEPYLAEIIETGKTIDENLIMASIVETEARQYETRRTIAGILWKRIELEMPLQVDVAFKYVNGKTTPTLTLEDLNINSPYNTYRNIGLPPTPIANPGLESILATINPIDTSYLYFLADDKGNVHYAKTFEDHKNNRRSYLR